jgi:hypothetical protein
MLRCYHPHSKTFASSVIDDTVFESGKQTATATKVCE